MASILRVCIKKCSHIAGGNELRPFTNRMSVRDICTLYHPKLDKPKFMSSQITGTAKPNYLVMGKKEEKEVRYLQFRFDLFSERSRQTVHTQSRCLIRAYTFCYSVCIFCAHMKSWRYVSFFFYLSRVNLGGKVVQWTRTLSQDSCSRYEPLHLSSLSPFFCLPISLTRPGLTHRENAKYRGIYAQFFVLVSDIFFLRTFFLTQGSGSTVKNKNEKYRGDLCPILSYWWG